MARTVYTSGPGGGRSSGEEREGAQPPAVSPRRGQRVRVRVERAGRRGKTVTVAAPLALPPAEAEELLGELKRACGSGGALAVVTTSQGMRAYALELQGDHAARLPDLLRERGFLQAR